ncbi:carbohydrate ABC transporter membrane protein 1 (CUT1 family) [Roseiarcus fermentans]|uniref:Carbohydrate ABC transporter membrane protein 1 (CUT1 family) n=1 Tax=Roseiarcus fermentans TaxID=1473586 RepID=A0A366F923_9HYPH|nr:sugar ABC transporter permease [Roseiarcus fermentans]RBP11127.1 carbohydrate ABC transporter membrane protein 1 (CUT1 family) [Roseiarcus fermentans]
MPIRRSQRLAARREAAFAALLVAPVLAWLGATLLYPLAVSLALSVENVRVIGSVGRFVGLDNYLSVLGSAAFWLALGRSVVWVVGNAVVQTALAMAAALVLEQSFPGVRIARTWIVLTWIVPTIVIVIVWRWLLSTSGGMINPLLIALGVIREPVGFFSTPASAMATLILINSWRWFPFIAVMLLAGLQRIPGELYEAAALDGASRFARFRRITLPLLQPTLFVLTVIGTLLSFNVFDIVWLLTGGGPANATTTLPILIYRTAFKGYRLSEAAAMSVVATVLLMGLALIAVRTLAPREEAR